MVTINIYILVAELWVIQMATICILNDAVRDRTKTVIKKVVTKYQEGESGNDTVTYVTPEEETKIEEMERHDKGIY